MFESDDLDLESTGLDFQITGNQTSIIKVIGIGGGGCNAVNFMFREGIKDVEFIVCNTDSQALDKSPVDEKIQIGMNLTGGNGVGGNPELGEKAAMEDIDKIKDALGTHTKMLFITSGMGGGTGTGAAPVIAKLAMEMDILTVGIVTVPFEFEGDRRVDIAERGVFELKNHVDALVIIKNERLMEMFNGLSIKKAWEHADKVLATAAKGIAEIITVPGEMNVDFEDVKTILKNSGTAILGSATVEGEDRAHKAVKLAIESPLLKDNDISGAEHILLNIVYGKKELEIEELNIITKYLKQVVGSTANTKLGLGEDESLGNKISVTIVATSLESSRIADEEKNIVDNDDERIIFPIGDDSDNTITNDTTANSVIEKKLNFSDEPVLKSDIEEEWSNETVLTPDSLDKIESIPAYLRKGIKLKDIPHSSDINISRFTLGEDEDKKPRINDDNPYLDPQVD